jgi:prevent-host-death family protein
MEMHISVAEAHNRLSRWLNKAQEEPITITRRGKPVGVIVSLDEYEQLRRVRAYLQMLRLAQSLSEDQSGMAADELYRASRAELEQRT